jgi:hypothetical protein
MSNHDKYTFNKIYPKQRGYLHDQPVADQIALIVTVPSLHPKLYKYIGISRTYNDLVQTEPLEAAND